MARYKSTKTYGHNLGLSAAFRQWRATHSHCQLIHGYALQVGFVFESVELDERNWVVDFGGVKEVKKWLEYMFDHTYLVAEDDPFINTFRELEEKGLLDLRVVKNTGCEAFAQLIFEHVNPMIEESTEGRCWVKSVEVREHGANSAIYEG